jgi:GT2 family glycosyltransferase
MADPRVSVAIVTYNSSRYIERCLDAVSGQYAPLEVVVADNASTDGTLEILERYGGRIRVIRNRRNEGFAAAQNQIIRSTSSGWVLTLNPDVLMRPGFIRGLVEAGEMDPEAGAVCGKLLSIGPGFRPLRRRIVDSAGLYVTPEMRHFDRGWHEPDGDRFNRAEYVFGASAAAALYRRSMIDDIAIENAFFDPDFFYYREDADVAWRAQLLGWRCIYTPSASAFHVRAAPPGDRRRIPPAINMHSVKNRFLLRIKNTTFDLYRRHWLPTTCRDLLVVGGCFLCEPRSLVAFWKLAGCVPRALRARREIMRRRRAGDQSVARWFSSEPASQPLAGAPAREGAARLAASAAG